MQNNVSSLNMIFNYYCNDFWHKRKIYNFDTNIVFWAIATWDMITFYDELI